MSRGLKGRYGSTTRGLLKFYIFDTLTNMNAYPGIPAFGAEGRTTGPTPIIKIGDGVNTFASLPQINGGGGGSDKNAAFQQTIAATTWNWNHGLGKYVTPIVTDSSRNVIYPSNIQIVDINNITVTHSSPQTGYIFAN